VTEITPHNVLRHELIGLNAKITRTKDPTLKGIQGIVVDETRNMITLRRKDGTLRVPKNVSTFRFRLRNGTLVEVDGARLVGRPENRLKTRVRRW
jgi:ribonuclease P protein subunit POP4